MSDAIFIDRDGVINVDPIGDYIKRWEDFRLIPGVLTALKSLSDSGFDIIIISNQAGIGDGVYPKSALDEITDNMLSCFEKEAIKIRKVYYCLHGKKRGCDCRKPKTGLFKQAAQDFSFEPSKTYFVGDKATDMQAGSDFGLRNIFVLTGHGKMDRTQLNKQHQVEHIAPSIVEAVQYVLTAGSLR